MDAQASPSLSLGLTPQERRKNRNVPEIGAPAKWVAILWGERNEIHKQYVHHILVPEFGAPKDEQGEFLG